MFRAGNTAPVRGGVMAVDSRGFDGLGEPEAFCQEAVRECIARGFSGALLDFEGLTPGLARVAARLDESFARRGWTLYVPEPYGSRTVKAQVLISSALSGGSLALRLEEAAERFGLERVTLALEKAAEDFYLPSPTGGGVPLEPEELERRMEELRPCVFFSAELCARYFTYMGRDNGAHFVLFDDGDTLRRKIEVARQAGVHSFSVAWVHVRDHGEQMGLRRTVPAGRRGRGPG